MADNLLPFLKKQILDYDSYAQGFTKIIGYSGYPHSDCTVKDQMTYAHWVNTLDTYPVIKLEGLEQFPKLVKHFKYLRPQNIHLFASQRNGMSFKWHKDDIDVLLYVVKGYKLVEIRNQRHILRSGQSVYIPKRHLHRVVSKADTWALSVGFYK